MMSLTELSYQLRRIAPIAIAGFVFFILFFFLLKSALDLIPDPVQPPVSTEPVINECFGKIPKISFSKQIEYPTVAEFTIDNIEGKPITPSQNAEVFFLKKNLTRFGYLTKISQMARVLGFDTETNPYILQESTAIFEDAGNKFEVDISDFNFKYDFDYKNNFDLISSSVLPGEREITENAKQFLRVMNTYPEELVQGKTNIIYLKLNASTAEFEVVDDPSIANAAEVDFFRSDIKEYPIVPPSYFNSQNFVTLIFKDGKSKVIRSQLSFFEKKESEGCYYPIKTGEEAWNDLKQKRGAIVSAGSGTTDIVIKNMFLGYYDPDDYQEYLQPIYVFLGDEGFVAYVEALREGYTE